MLRCANGLQNGQVRRHCSYHCVDVSRFHQHAIILVSDLILLMFDPSKLDISDELKSVIEELQPFEEKVHCVLNKADNLDTESLMRVSNNNNSYRMRY